MNYYKATRPDGTDFRTGTVDYGAALGTGLVVRHPQSQSSFLGDPSTYLSVATVATDCTGVRWPCRLFLVSPVGAALKADDHLPNKRRVLALRVEAELSAHEIFGPQGIEVAALIERAGRLTRAEANDLHAAGDAAGDATFALVMRDLISQEHFDALYGPWASVITS